ncbi:transporter substrate-binding domain-containing protein [Mesorhizobium sp. VK23B]|uniref:Transporter substrate-binding domain-containing protein n=1 Tax=Mesorhizobium dulcispinae TaxID=3072316 RepID=A0ABU4XAA1_9HYPH|nr:MULTISPECIES: transporter substrate-binding domain-containing protein [unclassified Mesorhizobium]MDX8464695.1 transporter substrate-binding domain-containing protein [Mesorhizobium sp. VK23B]MDX8471081.1 transporter substrate-binding domain-containing protein [Mesorhizobium sp. VK23A]
MMMETVKLGMLFSQTGPMAVTENAHIQGVLIACDEINAKGGIDGRPLELVVADPAGDDARYEELATDLLLRQHVGAIVGCCLSSSRKRVVPVVERYNGVLLYPSVYEGFEYSPNVIYGGAVPNQVIVPMLEYLFANHGKRIGLIGSDTLYAREINRIVNEFLGESGGTVIGECYFPFATSTNRFAPTLKRFVDEAADAIISTVVGEDSVTLYDTFSRVEKDGRAVPIASLTTTESELHRMSPGARTGHLSSLPYFGSLDIPKNRDFVDAFQKRYGTDKTPGIYTEVCYALVHIFADAVRQTGDADSDAILPVLSGAVFKGPGGDRAIDLDNNHFVLRPMIGRASERGGFDIVWKSPGAVRPDPYLVSYDRSLAV